MRFVVLSPLILAALLLAAPVARAAEAAEPVATDDPKVAGLVEQLGSNDFAKREAAMRELRAIGKPALPALKRAADGEDAEVATRARTFVRRIESRPVPEPLQNLDGFGRGTGVRISAADGARVTDVREIGRTTRIVERDDGVTMTVTGQVDGKRATETYTAASIDDLRNEQPDAYAHYEQVSGVGGVGGGGLVIRGGGVVQLQRNIQLGGLQMVPLQIAGDELDLLRVRLEKQMREKNVKDEKYEEVVKELDKVVEARVNGIRDMEQYTRQCDEFRKVLEAHQLDAGDLLPPPAKTRLGVSVQAEGAALVIQRIAENSRAQRIGLREQDEILKVDGKDVLSVADLRKLVGAKEKGLTMDVVRDGRQMKLVEKDEEKK